MKLASHRIALDTTPAFKMLTTFSRMVATAAMLRAALACDGCYGAPAHDVVLTRHVRRSQPDAQNATSGPRGPLEWGQINFLHTTDTHGWLEGRSAVGKGGSETDDGPGS